MGEMTGSSPLLLVTGAGGFLGGRVVAAAVRRGCRVRAHARRPIDPEIAWARAPGVSTRIADLADPTADLDALIADADAVVHVAAAMRGGDDVHNRDTVEPTRRLLAAAARAAAKPRIVLVSSIAVYNCASTPAGAQLDETSPRDPEPALRDAYSRAKLAQEALAMRAAQDLGLEIRAMRPGAIFGPGRLWTARIGFRFGPATLRVGGDAPTPAIHVEDCAEAIVAAALTPALRSDIPTFPGSGLYEIVNLVDDDQPSIRAYHDALSGGRARRTLTAPFRLARLPAQFFALAGLVFPGLARRLPGALRLETFDARFKPLRVSNARMRERLGWRPRRPVLDLVAEEARR